QQQNGAVADIVCRQRRRRSQRGETGAGQPVAPGRRRCECGEVVQDVDDRRDQGGDGYRGGKGQVDGDGAGVDAHTAQPGIGCRQRWAFRTRVARTVVGSRICGIRRSTGDLRTTPAPPSLRRCQERADVTISFVPAARRLPPARDAPEIAVAAPPEVAPTTSSGLLVRLLPAVLSVASLGVMATAVFSGSEVTRNPAFLALPMMMLISALATALAGRGRGPGAGIDADRVGYLGYLSGVRRTVVETAAAQRTSLWHDNPDPGALWTLIGGP